MCRRFYNLKNDIVDEHQRIYYTFGFENLIQINTRDTQNSSSWRSLLYRSNYFFDTILMLKLLIIMGFLPFKKIVENLNINISVHV